MAFSKWLRHPQILNLENPEHWVLKKCKNGTRVRHACSPRTWEAEAGGLSQHQSQFISMNKVISSLPEIQFETLSENKQKKQPKIFCRLGRSISRKGTCCQVWWPQPHRSILWKEAANSPTFPWTLHMCCGTWVTPQIPYTHTQINKFTYFLSCASELSSLFHFSVKNSCCVRAVCKHRDIRVLMLKVKYGEEKTDPERARNLPRSSALQSAAEAEPMPTVAWALDHCVTACLIGVAGDYGLGGQIGYEFVGFSNFWNSFIFSS